MLRLAILLVWVVQYFNYKDDEIVLIVMKIMMMIMGRWVARVEGREEMVYFLPQTVSRSQGSMVSSEVNKKKENHLNPKKMLSSVISFLWFIYWLKPILNLK